MNCEWCLLEGRCGNAGVLLEQAQHGSSGGEKPLEPEKMVQYIDRLIELSHQEHCLHPEKLEEAITQVKENYGFTAKLEK